jgi:hypothetical protein
MRFGDCRAGAVLRLTWRCLPGQIATHLDALHGFIGGMASKEEHIAWSNIPCKPATQGYVSRQSCDESGTDFMNNRL